MYLTSKVNTMKQKNVCKKIFQCSANPNDITFHAMNETIATSKLVKRIDQQNHHTENDIFRESETKNLKMSVSMLHNFCPLIERTKTKK